MTARRLPNNARGRTRPVLRAPRTRRSGVSGSGIKRAAKFLAQLERLVLREIREACGALSKTNRGWKSVELPLIFDLAHIAAHWHDDSAYVDPTGRPRLLPLKGPEISLGALIARVFPSQSTAPIVRALLASGIIRTRGDLFECSSRQVVFPGMSAYISGLIPIVGLASTLRANLTGRGKRLQQTVLNSQIPRRELPALYRSIERRTRPLLEATDIEMLRSELRVQKGEPLTRLGLAIQMFELPRELIPLIEAQPKAIRRKNSRHRK
jgi:hypothetical protein